MKTLRNIALATMAGLAMAALSATPVMAAPPGYSCTTYDGAPYDGGDSETCHQEMVLCSNGSGGTYNHEFTICIHQLQPL